MKWCLVGVSMICSITLMAQKISAEELLNRAIEFHDPNDHWNDLKAILNITLEMPDKAGRFSKITIDNRGDYFKLEEKTENSVIVREINKGNCLFTLNGKSEFTEEEISQHKLVCDRSTMMRNYYTYLYGLPMKLKDDGTIIHPEVLNRNFKGVDYLVLKVTYDKEVGNDTWYFYFNPKNYAMEVYQFFHKEDKNDGEYILLSELMDIEGIKMPKIRKWYVNKDNSFLGADVLTD